MSLLHSEPRRPYSLYALLFAAVALAIAWPFFVDGVGFAYIDIGTDTYSQFYPLQVGLSRHLRETHDLTWSFQMGLGGYMGSHFDLFWMLQALLPESAQMFSRILAYLLKLGLAGLFMLAYLRQLGFRGLLPVLGALGYAFGNFATVNGQWDMHATELLQFAALLFLVERYLRTGFASAAVFAGLAVGLGQGFNLFTCGLFTLLYVAARSYIAAGAGAWATGSRLRLLAMFPLFALLGYLIAAPVHFPALFYLLDSPRVSGAHSALQGILSSILQINDWHTLGSEIFGLLGKDLLGVGGAYKGWANYLEGPGFYVGLPALLMSLQLLSPQATRAERRLFWVGAIGLCLFFLFPAFRYAVYGFGHISFRLSNLWLSMLILVGGMAGMRRMLLSGVCLPALWAGAGMIALATLAAMIVLGPLTPYLLDANLVTGHPPFAGAIVNPGYALGVLGLTAVYVTLTFVMQRPEWRHVLPALFLAVFTLELVVLVRPALVERDTVSVDGSSRTGNYRDGTPAALALIRARHSPGDFYRVEKAYNSVFLCDSLFQDYRGIRSYYFHGRGLTRFVDHMAIPRTIPHSNYIEAPLDRPQLLDMLAVRYLLSRDRRYDGVAGYAHIGTADGIEIYERAGARPLAMLHAHLISEAAAMSMPPAQRDVALLSGVAVDDPARYPALAAAGEVPPQPVELTLHGETHLSGKVHADDTRMLVLAMPFDRGWRASLNGRQVDAVQVDFGLLGVLVPAGEHDLVLHYTPPGRTVGLAAAGFGVLGVIFLAVRRRGRADDAAAPGTERPVY